MRPHRRSQDVLVLAVALSVLIVASSVTSAQAPAGAGPVLPSPGGTIRVALLAPFGDFLGDFGESVSNGASLAIGTLAPDWDIEVVEKNTDCSRPTAVAAATEVISDGIHYIVGDVCTGSTVGVSELAEANQVLMIAPTATGPDVTRWPDGQDKTFVYRAAVTDDVQGEVMATLAMGIGARTSAVMVNTDNPYSVNLAQAYTEHVATLGGVVTPTLYYTMGVYQAVVDELQTAAPAAVFLPDYDVSVNEIVGYARSQAIDAPFLGGDSWDSSALDLTGAEGCYFTSWFAAEDTRPIVDAFVDSYTSKYAKPPDGVAAHGYDAMAMLLTAISQAGADDATVARDALQGLAYEGVTGRTTFNAIGDPQKMVAVVTIEGGQRRLYRRVAPQESRSLVAGSVITTTDMVVSVEVPATLTSTLTMTYTPQLTTTMETGDLTFAGVSFKLTATDDEGKPVVTLSEPLTLTVTYLDADLAPGTDEETLEVLRWDADTEVWVALDVVSRDTLANTLTVLLDHLSEFALLAPERHGLFVPLLLR